MKPNSDSEPTLVVCLENGPLDTMLTLSELVERLVTSGELANRDVAREHIRHVIDHYHLPRRRRYPSRTLAHLSLLEAMESGDPEDIVDDARIALAISPHCELAWVVLADEPALPLSEKHARYERALCIYEQSLDLDSLGEEILSLDGRQYLRTKKDLALCQWDEGKKTEAVDTLWESLRLNPWDYQGVRRILADWLPQLNDDVQLGRLVREWLVSAEDADPTRAYTETLLYFRLDDYAAADAALARALKQNPYVLHSIDENNELADELAGEDVPPFVSESSSEYAEIVNACIGEGWRHTRGAVAWALRRVQEHHARR
jgi:tetratricopeptide (TPR) repeat protein